MANVWLEDISGLRYVRKAKKWTHTRAGKIKWHAAGRLVGYETLPPDAKSIIPRIFDRTVYWVADHDWCNDPEGVYSTGAPSEAVKVEDLL